MITLTGYNNGNKCYVDEKDITRVVDGHDLAGSRSYPWSDVTVFDNQTGKESVLRVIESARLIGKLMTEALRRSKSAEIKAKFEEKRGKIDPK